MMGKICRRGLPLLTALALTLPLAGAGARAQEASDPPPTVLWLEGNYHVATYLGEGLVEVGRVSILQEKGGLKSTSRSYLNLNGEEVDLPLAKWIELPSKELAWLYGGEGFHHGYMAVFSTTTGSGNEVIYHWGLLDPAGNFPVPVEYATEEEAWAQVGLSVPEFPYDYFPPDVNNDNLFGFVDEDGGLLVEHQFHDAMPFTGGMYTRVTGEDRIGLLKDPRLESLISDWAEPEVSAALSAGLVPSRCAGYYTYEITRSQMAALLVRYAEYTLGEELPVPAEHPFTDTQDAYIEKACAAGIVQGTGEGLFAPDKVVTREQLATMLYRAILHIDPEWTGGGALSAAYTDFDQVSDWAKEAVSSLIARKVMNGVSASRISPKTYCTTEQAILLVYRLAVARQG